MPASLPASGGQAGAPTYVRPAGSSIRLFPLGAPKAVTWGSREAARFPSRPHLLVYRFTCKIALFSQVEGGRPRRSGYIDESLAQYMNTFLGYISSRESCVLFAMFAALSATLAGARLGRDRDGAVERADAVALGAPEQPRAGRHRAAGRGAWLRAAALPDRGPRARDLPGPAKDVRRAGTRVGQGAAAGAGLARLHPGAEPQHPAARESGFRSALRCTSSCAV